MKLNQSTLLAVISFLLLISSSYNAQENKNKIKEINVNKVLFVLFKKADLTHEQCLAEWNGERHSSIVKKVQGLKKWVQNHVAAMPNETAPDGIGELWFDNSETMEKAMNSPEMAAAIEDAKRFLDMEKTYALIVNEKIVFE